MSEMKHTSREELIALRRAGYQQLTSFMSPGLIGSYEADMKRVPGTRWTTVWQSGFAAIYRVMVAAGSREGWS